MNIHSPHVQDFCHVGISLCFYHSWSWYESDTSTARLLPNIQTSKSFSLLLMSKGCMWACVFFPFPPLRHLLWTAFSLFCLAHPQPFAIELWVPARKSSANPFEVDRASWLRRRLWSSNALSSIIYMETHVGTWKSFRVQLANQLFVSCANKPRVNCPIHT